MGLCERSCSRCVACPYHSWACAIFGRSSCARNSSPGLALQALNVSLLTSDLYAAAARILFFDSFTARSAFAFGLSAVLVVSGLALFHLTAPASASLTRAEFARGAPEAAALSASGELSHLAATLEGPAEPSVPVACASSAV